ncbi:MAG: 50S ribosomal protein L2 [Candidatus Berkelbacteria bacterium]|nr:50S ribosomal protein L2 [Candidatus Berkelbacteria bacterium]
MSPIKIYNPTSPGRRGMTGIDYRKVLTKKEPEKSLVIGKKEKAGRSKGKVSVRHQGSGNKKLYRLVDFRQEKLDIPAKVKSIEYDPNRTAFIALITYQDGEKRYILASSKMKVNDEIIVSDKKVGIIDGNRMSLKFIPVGTPVHNIELMPKKGGEIVRSAGSSAIITATEDKFTFIRLPSSEVRKIPKNCMGSIGVVSNPEHNKIKIGKAGRRRWLGIRPTVRGKAMHPGQHPHGGGEGRSPVGLKYPKTLWGKHAKGVKTRKHNKYSNQFIVKRRKK